MAKYKTYTTSGNSLLAPGSTKGICYNTDNPSDKTEVYVHGNGEEDKNRAMNKAQQEMADKKLSQT